MSITDKTPAKAHDPLLLPNGTRLTRDFIRRARLSLPPIRCRNDPPWVRPPFRLYPVLDGQDDPVGEVWIWWERGLPRFGRSRFVQSFRKELGHDECGEVSVAAEDRNWARVHALDPVALPWFCPECGRNHAEAAWKIFTRWNWGKYDGCAGTCPEGHERLIAR